MNNKIVQYVRKDKFGMVPVNPNVKELENLYVKTRISGERIGVVVARKREDGTVGIGWSKVNSEAGDSFVREKALEIAEGRAGTNFDGRTLEIPRDCRDVFKQVVDKARRYFHGAELNIDSAKVLFH